MLNFIWISASLFALLNAVKPQAQLWDILPALIVILLILLWKKYQAKENINSSDLPFQDKQAKLQALITEIQNCKTPASIQQIQYWLFDCLSHIQERPQMDQPQSIDRANHLAQGEHQLNRAWSAQLDQRQAAAYQAQQQALEHFQAALVV